MMSFSECINREIALFLGSIFCALMSILSKISMLVIGYVASDIGGVADMEKVVRAESPTASRG